MTSKAMSRPTMLKCKSKIVVVVLIVAAAMVA